MVLVLGSATDAWPQGQRGATTRSELVTVTAPEDMTVTVQAPQPTVTVVAPRPRVVITPETPRIEIRQAEPGLSWARHLLRR